MAQPRLPFRRLIATVAMWALPGLAVIVALAFLKIIPVAAAFAAALVCVLIAAILAMPVLRDLATLAQYGDQLARRGAAGSAEFSGWEPAAELAAIMRMIQRGAEMRARGDGEELRTSHRIFAALPQPLLLLDAERRITAANDAARDMAAADPTGSDLAVAIRDPRVLEAADRTLATGARQAAGFTIVAPVERYFWAEVVPLGTNGEDAAKVMMVLTDLTERRQAERMRGDFVANASHELRTPLATLIGFIETLRGPAHDDAAARDSFLELMQQQADRMSRLVRDLLSLSAIERNEHAPPQAPVDITAVVERVVAALRLEAAKKEVTLAVETAGPVRAVIGDEEQLTQLFQNLIDNAVKYGRTGGRVRIHIDESPDIPPALPQAPRERPVLAVVRIAVSDDGDGIAPEHLPRLTERFYRVDPARSRAVGGTGLGLAIVKHIINRHRGILRIDSRPGQGSTFTAVLPISQ